MTTTGRTTEARQILFVQGGPAFLASAALLADVVQSLGP